MDKLQYIFRQNIGIFFKDITWKDNVYNEIKNYYEERECISLTLNFKGSARIELKDGSVIYFVPANDCSRGHRFSKAILQPGIDKEIIDCVIRPSIVTNCFYVYEEEKWKLTRDEILKLVDKVKASDSENKEFIVYGTEEYINQVKDYLPPNVSAKIVPTNYLPEEKDNLIYVIPIDEKEIKPLKFVF